MLWNSRFWLILWGAKVDFMRVAYLQKWKKRMPNVSVKAYDYGHFVQEEKTKETIQEIEKFMKGGYFIQKGKVILCP